MAATEKNKQTKVKWTGLGLWNVFLSENFYSEDSDISR